VRSKTRSKKDTKFIIVTGGVLSGLGKGITTASIGRLLSSRLKVVTIKCDGYLNTDPGTMNPIEHGEVFVLDDGGECDMDFGHYERFIDVHSKSEWNLTMGKIYKKILDRERDGDFLGQTVQLIPHVTDEIKQEFYRIAEKERADIMLIEIGGTIGDMENELFLESVRQLRYEAGPDNTALVHLSYVPIPYGVNEQKSKPTQQSVKKLNERGLYPDLIIGRGPLRIVDKIKKKIALFCNVEPSAVVSAPDVDNVYEMPLIFEEEGVAEILHKKLNIYSPPNLNEWRRLVENMREDENKIPINVAICGKYTDLHDSYASILEALTHCKAHVDVDIETSWVETTEIENKKRSIADSMKGVDAVIVPGGFGTRGIEGKIDVIQYCRENKIPFLGICYGMQLAVIEYARNVCGIKDAHSAEIEADGQCVGTPIVCYLPDQIKVTRKGGTMRLGGHDIAIKEGTKAFEYYGGDKVRRRFRHRYEINPEYIDVLEDKGMVFSGYAPNSNIMQIMELKGHPFMMGSQFHPELHSKLEKPEELFYHLIKAAREHKLK